MIAVISSAGVTSKAGLKNSTPSGAVWRAEAVGDFAPSRCSIGICAPVASDRSMVLVGAATKNGMRKCRARIATPSVPILLATSPLAAMRSAPTMTASHLPLLHHRRGHVVADHGDGDAVLLQLVGGDAAALQQRAGLVGEDVEPHALLGADVDRGQGRAVLRRWPARRRCSG